MGRFICNEKSFCIFLLTYKEIFLPTQYFQKSKTILKLRDKENPYFRQAGEALHRQHTKFTKKKSIRIAPIHLMQLRRCNEKRICKLCAWNKKLSIQSIFAPSLCPSMPQSACRVQPLHLKGALQYMGHCCSVFPSKCMSLKVLFLQKNFFQGERTSIILWKRKNVHCTKTFA